MSYESNFLNEFYIDYRNSLVEKTILNDAYLISHCEKMASSVKKIEPILNKEAEVDFLAEKIAYDSTKKEIDTFKEKIKTAFPTVQEKKLRFLSRNFQISFAPVLKMHLLKKYNQAF